MSNDNSGSAFPVNTANLGQGGAYSPQPGMTLRDYFAAKALAGMLANSEPGFCRSTTVGDFDKVAGWAYMHADAMLEARGEG